MDIKQLIWDEFCNRLNVAERSVPLFKTNAEGKVLHKLIGKDQRPVLIRSIECEETILTITDLLVSDWNSGIQQYDGMLYMMGWKQMGKFVPLYIGKTETIGKGDKNLSVNIKNLHKDKSKFARWGDNYAYHIGDLSACVLPGHLEQKKTRKYQTWADCLFVNGSQLKEPVFFWATAWRANDVGIWKEFGETSLAFLE